MRLFLRIYLTLFFSFRLSMMICLTNATSPPVTMLSRGEAVLIDLGSGRSSERLVNKPHASRLLPKNGGLHIQKSYVSSSLTAPHSLVAGDTCKTVQGQYSVSFETITIICKKNKNSYHKKIRTREERNFYSDKKMERSKQISMS